MDNTASLSLIAGFLAPVAIAVLNRRAWSPQTKGVVAFALCLLAAGFVAWYERQLNSHNLRETLPLVFGAAIISYGHFWKPSGIAPKIEQATG